MNIHEHQAKDILKDFGAPTTEGVIIFNSEGIIDKIKDLNTDQFVLKAQIHAGGRGKAGGVKLVKKKDIVDEAKKLFGKVLVKNLLIIKNLHVMKNGKYGEQMLEKIMFLQLKHFIGGLNKIYLFKNIVI